LLPNLIPYEQKLICFDTGLPEFNITEQWRFDLNKLYENKY